MAFIPNELKHGDKVILLRSIYVLGGVFEKGTEMTLVSFSARGWDLIDNKGNWLRETFMLKFQKVN